MPLCLFYRRQITTYSWQYQTLIASIVVFIGLIAVAVLVDAQKSDATQDISGTFILYALFSLFALIILILIVYNTAYNANLLYNMLHSAVGIWRTAITNHDVIKKSIVTIMFDGACWKH